SDLAVALLALDAVVHLESAGGRRQVPLREFYRLPGQTPQVETVLQTGEMLVNVTCAKVPGAARSRGGTPTLRRHSWVVRSQMRTFSGTPLSLRSVAPSRFVRMASKWNLDA